MALEIKGNEITVYSRGLNLFAQTKGTTTKTYFSDDHGNVTAMYSSATDGEEALYDGFGNTLFNDSSDNPFGYCGEYYDEETGLIYLRARYYDPETGRFISEDPAMDGTNWYVYCSNNPVMFVDPWGLASYIFYADGMGDQAKVRADIYTEQYGTNSYIIHVGSAKEFIDSWNDNVIFPIEPIDAIEIISHGSITGDTGMNKNGSANSTGYLYFGKDDKDRLFARTVQNMKSGDYSVYKLFFAEAKELHINACNSANPDTYNIVYGFMQRTDILYETTGFDGGAMWSEEDKDHVMGGGEVLTGFKAFFLGKYYYVKKYQATWWKYVDKDDGEPIRSREGERCFYSY